MQAARQASHDMRMHMWMCKDAARLANYKQMQFMYYFTTKLL